MFMVPWTKQTYCLTDDGKEGETEWKLPLTVVRL